MWMIFLVFYFSIKSISIGFNLDIETRIEFVPKYNKSLFNYLNQVNEINFGISLAILKNENTFYIFIGAPNLSNLKINNFESTGCLFKCNLTSRHSQSSRRVECLPIDLVLNTGKSLKEVRFMQLSNALAAGKNKFLICASGTLNEKITENYYPIGACYYNYFTTSNSNLRKRGSLHTNDNRKKFDLDDLIELNTLLSLDKQIQRSTYFYSHAMLGFSVQISKEDEKLFVVGAPGFNEWSGAVLQYKFYNSEKKLINLYHINYKSYSYFGYAVTLGKFFNDGQIYCAASAPKYKSFGAVFIFKLNFKNLINQVNDIHLKKLETLYGQTNGEYFGYSIQALDLNNDGLDDLIVSSPFYSISNKDQKDNGAVYVFFSDGNLFKDAQIILGSPKANGMFGSSLVAAGDLDQDGYQDFAVGAPYEYESRGCVYIFNGQKNFLITQYSQKICAKDFDQKNYFGFGSSLLGSFDINQNGYPDLLIGSYLSSNAILLKTKPVIYVKGYFIIEPDTIDLNSTSYFLKNNSNSKIFTTLKLSYCHQINSPYLIKSSLITDIQLDAKFLNNSRANFDLNEIFLNFLPATKDSFISFTNILESNVLVCYSSLPITIKNDIKDKLNPITVIATHKIDKNSNLENEELILKNENEQFSKLIYFRKLFFPEVYKSYFGLKLSVDIYEKETAKNNLNLSFDNHSGLYEKELLQNIILGKHESIELIVEIVNHGSTVHSTLVTLDLSIGLMIKKYESKCKVNTSFTYESDNKFLLNEMLETDLNLICYLGNLVEYGTVKLKFILELNQDQLINQESIFINVRLNTNTNLTKTSILKKEINLPIKRYASLEFIKNVHENIVVFYNLKKSNQILNLPFSEPIRLMKSNFSSIREIQFLIQVPSFHPNIRSNESIITDVSIQNLDGSTFFCKTFDNNKFKRSKDQRIKRDLNLNYTYENENKNKNENEIDVLYDLNLNHIQTGAGLETILELNCNTLECATYTCIHGNVGSGNRLISFNLLGKLNLSLINEIFGSNFTTIKLETNIEVSILDKEFYLDFFDIDFDLNPNKLISSTKKATLFKQLANKQQNLILMFASGILIGLTIITILVYLLIKAGFFHRRKREEIRKMKLQQQITLLLEVPKKVGI